MCNLPCTAACLVGPLNPNGPNVGHSQSTFNSSVNRAGATASVYLFGSAVMTSVLIIVTMRVSCSVLVLCINQAVNWRFPGPQQAPTNQPTPPAQVAIRTQYWTVLNHAAIWGSLGLWLPFLGLLAALCSRSPGLAPLCGLGAGLLETPVFWAGAVLAAPAAALLADYSLMVFSRLLWPKPSQILQVGGLRNLSLWAPVGCPDPGSWAPSAANMPSLELRTTCSNKRKKTGSREARLQGPAPVIYNSRPPARRSRLRRRQRRSEHCGCRGSCDWSAPGLGLGGAGGSAWGERAVQRMG
jgi:hypothetical protein